MVHSFFQVLNFFDDFDYSISLGVRSNNLDAIFTVDSLQKYPIFDVGFLEIITTF